ncbi:hypothetical protein ABPG75_013612 [Micractinium tetrahymenae]
MPGSLSALVWLPLLAAAGTGALDDGQALVPPMGLNTWNAFGANISEAVVKEMADLMESLGLVAAGYRYLVLDDGWSDPERTQDGRLQADRQRFPSGKRPACLPNSIKALSGYLAGKGLLLGVYSDSGGFTCQGFPGSRGHEAEDARSFADWGVSLLKYDNCYTHDDLLERFVAMRDALNATGRPILYQLCEWGIGDPWLWGPRVAHTWRTTFDIHSSWASVMQNLDESIGLARYAGPGHWNDLDLLEVGTFGPQPNGWEGVHGASLGPEPGGAWQWATPPRVRGQYLSEKEERAHFALWAILKSPLFIAADLRRMAASSLAILRSKEVIAINQDPLGVPGDLIWKSGPKEIYAASLSGGGRAVVLHNRHSILSHLQAANITVRWAQLGYAPEERAAVRDLYRQQDLGMHAGSFTAEVRLHDVAVLRITPQDPQPAQEAWRPWQGQPMFERHEEDEGWIPEPLRAAEGRQGDQQ